jgi:hypothetical protein
MKKEYVFIGLIGLYILTYVLDAVVDPFQLQRATPYHYLAFDVFLKFPFTFTSIFLKALLLFLSPLWIFSFVDKNYGAKAMVLLVISALLQLYAIQQVATAGIILPLEWTLALAYGGALLLVPTLGYAVMGIFASMQTAVKRMPVHVPTQEKTVQPSTEA